VNDTIIASNNFNLHKLNDIMKKKISMIDILTKKKLNYIILYNFEKKIVNAILIINLI